MHKDDEQHSAALRRRNHERKNEIDVKITYFNKREREKRVRGVILGQKLTLYHPSLMDEGQETRVLVTAHKREGEERVFYRSLFSIAIYSFKKLKFYLHPLGQTWSCTYILQFQIKNIGS